MVLSPAIGPIVCISIPVPDLQGAVELYGKWFKYQERARGHFTDSKVICQNLPKLAGRAWRYLTPSSPDSLFGGLRLIDAGPIPSTPSPLTTIGWAAAELSVKDVDGLATRLTGSPFKIIGPPGSLESNASIKAMQVAGPYGEVFYLADVGAYEGPLSLTRATCPIDRTFVAVLATHDLETTRDFYETRYATQRISDHEVTIPVLNQAFSAPAGTRFHISSQQLAGGSLIEIDELPLTAKRRAPLSSGLPAGIAMVTLATNEVAKNLTEIADIVGGCGNIVTGRAGELIEFVGRSIDLQTSVNRSLNPVYPLTAT